MGNPLAATEMAAILKEYPEIYSCKAFVETGGCAQSSAAEMSTLFRECHSIQAATDAADCCDSGVPGVHFHRGDTRQILREICPQISEPTVFVLDTALPFLEELSVIADRKKQDLIVIDEYARLGSGSSISDGVTFEHVMGALVGRRIRDSFCRDNRMFLLLAPEVATIPLYQPGETEEPSEAAPEPEFADEAAAQGARQVPDEFLAQFTMNGAIPIEYNDVARPEAVGSRERTYSIREITTHMYGVFLGALSQHGVTDHYLYQALKAYPIVGKRVVVYGSPDPHYESVALAHGALSVVSVDYDSIVSEHPLVGACTPEQFLQHTDQYDVGIAIGAFESLGLGIDGRGLEADADVRAMTSLRTALTSGGLLFVALPLGRDRLVWEERRIYGRTRAPLLLEGWQHVDTFGLQEGQLDSEEWRRPVLVLTPAPATE